MCSPASSPFGSIAPAITPSVAASIAVLLGSLCGGLAHAAADASDDAYDDRDAAIASLSTEQSDTQTGSALSRASAAVSSPQSAGAGLNDAPRFIRSDSLIDARPSLPGYRSDVTELSYRWWKSKGRADVGLGLGTLTYATRPTGMLSGPPQLRGLPGDSTGAVASATGTVLTLGMRYRTSEGSAVYADAAGVRGPGLEGTDAVVGKVGIEFKSAQSRLNIAYGGLGMRLAGDTRMTLRLRRGGLGVVMKRDF